jgi:phosphoserine phosphatase RsbU/P
MWTLRITIGGKTDSIQELAVGKDLVLGRDPTADVVLSERSVSRRHCRVTGTPLGVDVVDLNSANGVWVGGRQVETARLKAGGEMLIGNVGVVVGRKDGPTGMVPLVEETSSDAATDPSLTSSSSPRSVRLEVSQAAYRGLEKERLALLIEAGKSLASAGGGDQVLERVMDHLFQLLPVKRAVLALAEPDGRLVARTMRPAVEAGELSEVCSRHIIQQVMDEKEARIIEDASLDLALNQAHSVLHMNIKAAICAPLVAQNRALGAIYADYPGKARLYSRADLDFFGAFASIAAVALENARLQEDARDRMKIQRDLEIAAEIQRGLLPDRGFEHPGIDLDWAYRPSRMVGGDFYDCAPTADGRVTMALGDVSGKSVGAALYMARVMSFLRATWAEDPSPAKVFEKTNHLLGARSDGDSATFATAACLLVDVAGKEVRWASAGHNPVLVYHPSTDVFDELGATGPPLGVVAEMRFGERVAALTPGAVILLYTDGLVEARNKEGEFFGLEHVMRIVRRVHQGGPRDVSHALLAAVEAHWQSSEYLKDDFAILVGRLT